MAQRPRPEHLVAVLILAVGLAIPPGVVLWVENVPTPRSWTAESVLITTSNTWPNQTVPLQCVWLNTTAITDLFCLGLRGETGFLSVTGNFSHGGPGQSGAVVIDGLNRCASACNGGPANLTWTSPDRTGQVNWAAASWPTPGGVSVTLRAID